MRWQRVARAVLVVFGLGLAVAIYVMTRERPPEDAPPPPLPADERDASQAGGPGVIFILEEGKRTGELRFARSAQYDDGRSRFEQARYTDLRGFAFTAAAVVARGALAAGEMPRETDLIGAVTFEDESGLRVETRDAAYDSRDGVLTMPGEVTFARGRVSGSGTGGIYERDAETVRLLADAVARIAPGDDGAGAAEATSATMTLRRGQKSLEMHQDARIRTEAETLSGDMAHLFFTDDETALRFLELRGHASVVPADPAGGGAPEMHADDITMTFHPDGRAVEHATLTGRASLQIVDAGGRRTIRAAWIDLFTAPDGRTLTRLEGKGDVSVTLPPEGETPAREILAATLLATGTPARGLQQARFQSNVRFVERGVGGGADRTVTSNALVLGLDGGLEAIERAEFERDVVFLDGGTRGDADLMVYDAAKQRVLLTPGKRTPPRMPRVTDADVTVNAESIDLDLRSNDLLARGGVTTVSAPRTEGRSALFEGSEPILGAGAELDYRRATRTATYTGTAKAPARVVQGQNVVEGAGITFAEDSGNLDARGGVTTTFLLTSEGAAAPVEYRTTAQTFTYDDGKRVAVYGSDAPAPVVEMVGSDKSVTVGRLLTLTFAGESRAVEALRVDGEVWARLPDGAEVKGQTLVYREATGIYVLTGAPAMVTSAPDGKSDSCTRTMGESIEFNQRTKAVTQRRAGQAFNQATPWPCGKSIR